MERIITYNELPEPDGRSLYIKMSETDPLLYLALFRKRYKLIENISEANESTIYVTGRRQDYGHKASNEYYDKLSRDIEDSLSKNGIDKPKSYKFTIKDLKSHKYKLPFVFKNERQNGGREKFLIATEEDYEKLIDVCNLLTNDATRTLLANNDDMRFQIDYKKYLNNCFIVQEYINTPSDYNTTVRLLTTPTGDLLYGSLKYNKKETYIDNTSLLGPLFRDYYPLSTKSIVSNTLRGGKNILLGEKDYTKFDKELLRMHDIESDKFMKLINSAMSVHKEYESELGVLCGFDFIYDMLKEKWYYLECHSKSMVGDYSIRQGIKYDTPEDTTSAEGRVRATALLLKLKK